MQWDTSDPSIHYLESESCFPVAIYARAETAHSAGPAKRPTGEWERLEPAVQLLDIIDAIFSFLI